MFNKLRELFNGNEDVQFSFNRDADGVDFFLEHDKFNGLKRGDLLDTLAAGQYVTLKMLAEQGLADTFPNGFAVAYKNLSQVDDVTLDTLGLPKKWRGSIKVDIKGRSADNTFQVTPFLTEKHGEFTPIFKRKGAFISFSESQTYILDDAEFEALQAFDTHQQSAKSESDNLVLVHALKQCTEQTHHAKYDLSHFDNFDISVPNTISISTTLDDEGNLVLTPYAGQSGDPENLYERLGQVLNTKSKALKIGNEILLLDDEKIEAIKEVVNNRKILKENVKDFMQNPTSYINASLIDLDVGFSIRVKGATTFKHAYYGDVDIAETNWFGDEGEKPSIVYPILKAQDFIEDKETFGLFEQAILDSLKTGATSCMFEGKEYDVSDTQHVTHTLENIKEHIHTHGFDKPQPKSPTTPDEPKEKLDKIVVDVDLNDDVVETAAAYVAQQIKDVSYHGDLEFDDFKRSPYPHQEEGIRWILGMMEYTQTEKDKSGALLADDMGLGKTYMALAASKFYYDKLRHKQLTLKPTLIVAPLSLLENWKDEVYKTFEDSPFKDIVILQSGGDLKKFRMGGVETKGKLEDDEQVGQPSISLKIGKTFGFDRLDMPQRLVITTYQTLRDYQFSMCSIDWGMVVFDEGQNIKNPNAIQTRAAKGLKSDFKLVTTGTPVENSLADFWCLFDTACPGLLGEYQQFRERYIAPIVQAEQEHVDDVREVTGLQLRKDVGAMMLRRIKEDNLDGLPDKTIFVGSEKVINEIYDANLEVTMQGYQLDVYNAVLNDKHTNEETHSLSAIRELRNTSLHPRLTGGSAIPIPRDAKEFQALVNESSKLDITIKLLSQIQKRQEKVIIFIENKRLQPFMSLALAKHFKLPSIDIINGDVKAVTNKKDVPTRKSIIEDFEAVEGFNIIIMSPVAAGVGLTVVGANNVIHYERHWNPAKEAQATDRVYRIGQEKDVNVYVPIAHHPEKPSFDLSLHLLLSRKTQLKDAVVTPEDVHPDPDLF